MNYHHDTTMLLASSLSCGLCSPLFVVLLHPSGPRRAWFRSPLWSNAAAKLTDRAERREPSRPRREERRRRPVGDTQAALMWIPSQSVSIISMHVIRGNIHLLCILHFMIDRQLCSTLMLLLCKTLEQRVFLKWIFKHSRPVAAFLQESVT